MACMHVSDEVRSKWSSSISDRDGPDRSSYRRIAYQSRRGRSRVGIGSQCARAAERGAPAGCAHSSRPRRADSRWLLHIDGPAATHVRRGGGEEDTSHVVVVVDFTV